MANVDDADEDSEPKDTQKLPVKAKAAKTGPLQPQVAFSAPKESGTIPRVSLSTFGVKDRKKKRLIISGISPNDSKKFEGAKRWCEVRMRISCLASKTQKSPELRRGSTDHQDAQG